MMRSIIQAVAVFFFVQFAMNQFTGKGTTQSADGSMSTPASTGPIPAWTDRPLKLAPGVQPLHVPEQIAPMWNPDQELDLMIYVSPDIILPPLKTIPKEQLVANEKDFGYGNWSDKREINVEFPVPRQ